MLTVAKHLKIVFHVVLYRLDIKDRWKREVMWRLKLYSYCKNRGAELYSTEDHAAAERACNIALKWKWISKEEQRVIGPKAYKGRCLVFET
jgi:hypothetical protein